MSSKTRARDFASCILFILIFSLPCILTAPTIQPYSEFLKYVTAHECYLPKEITPFSPSALGWFFLNEPLKQCDSKDANFETNTLCAEIFESFINTTCFLEPSIPIPKIAYKFSSNVCVDLAWSDNIIPKIENYFGGKLSDNTVCKVVCAAPYEILCKVLLWSYQVHHHIETAKNATKDQNKMKPVVNTVRENQNDLKSNIIPEDEVENPLQSQNEMNPVGNPNAVSSTPIIAETSDKTLPENNLQSEIAKTSFESQKRLIPAFPTQDKDDQDQSNREVQAKEQVEMVSSTNTNVPTASASEKSSNVQVTEVTKTTNQLENVKNTKVSSKIDTVIEETSEKNQNTTTNAKNTTEKSRKQDLKSKIKEKLSKNAIVEEINTSSPSPEINVSNDIAPQVETNEKLSDVESNQPGLKGYKSPQNSEISNLKEDPAIELVPKTPETGKKITLNSEKMVFPLDTVHNPEKDARLNSNKSSIASTKVVKSSDQDQGQQLSDGKDNMSSSKMEIKSTVEIQGIGTSIVTSESSDLEATTLEATLEEMDDANEVPPPVQEQDQYNDLENGDTEREYEKPDYDDALSPSTEVRKVVAQDSFITSEKSSVFNDQQNDISKLYDNLIPKSFGGQVSEDIRRIPPFPEEEDGHFFFYFLSVILILMIGYLVFHNKQKIIALIVEGRHERRRRSYGAAYKKLETK